LPSLKQFQLFFIGRSFNLSVCIVIVKLFGAFRVTAGRIRNPTALNRIANIWGD